MLRKMKGVSQIMKKSLAIFIMIVLVTFSLASIVAADTFDQVLQRWTKNKLLIDREFEDSSTLEIWATYYSAEFIEAYVQNEAKNNMWTQSETEDFKYNFVKALRLEDTIPIQIKFENNAETMYLKPFDIFVSLRIGKNVYKPLDYDKRFNFKFQGDKEGLVFFPRYDAKTGKDLLKGVKTVRLELKSTISPRMKNDVEFIYDIGNDDPQKVFKGKTADKMETDRLLKRLEKLRKDKAEIDAQLKTVVSEIDTIQKRLDELAKK